jgi:hypothetical protein
MLGVMIVMLLLLLLLPLLLLLLLLLWLLTCVNCFLRKVAAEASFQLAYWCLCLLACEVASAAHRASILSNHMEVGCCCCCCCCALGMMSLRYQPFGLAEPLCFVDIKASPRVSRRQP